MSGSYSTVDVVMGLIQTIYTHVYRRSSTANRDQRERKKHRKSLIATLEESRDEITG